MKDKAIKPAPMAAAAACWLYGYGAGVRYGNASLISSSDLGGGGGLGTRSVEWLGTRLLYAERDGSPVYGDEALQKEAV